MPSLRGYVPITEENKATWINWLISNLDYVQNQADRDSYANNRVFGTENDDIDEVQNVLASMYLTLNQFTLVPKNQTL